MVRGNDGQDMFSSDGERLAFLRLLREAAAKHEAKIHAYVLMSNHVHLLATGGAPGSLGRMVQSVGRRYVPFVNRAWGRRGSLWQARYRANLVDSQRYADVLLKYIEMNPVRAGMVPHPAAYIWSSHLHHAYGKPDDLLVPHEAYLRMGREPQARREAYVAGFGETLSTETLVQIRNALLSGEPFGSEEFVLELQRTSGRRVLRRRGRPKRDAVPDFAALRRDLAEKGV